MYYQRLSKVRLRRLHQFQIIKLTLDVLSGVDFVVKCSLSGVSLLPVNDLANQNRNLDILVPYRNFRGSVECTA